MVDVGPLLKLGADLAASAINTFGTEVTLAVVTTSEADPVTLETTTTTVPIGGRHKAILTKNGLSTGEAIPGVIVAATDWKLTFLPKTPTVAQDVIVTVVKSRDKALIGRTAKVLGGIREGAGVTLVVYARPLP